MIKFMSTRTKAAALVFTLALPALAEDSNNTSITNGELAHVVGDVIALKARCIDGDNNACEQSDAIMKMFKSYALKISSISVDKKKHMGLLMQSFVDGFTNGAAEPKAQQGM